MCHLHISIITKSTHDAKIAAIRERSGTRLELELAAGNLGRVLRRAPAVRLAPVVADVDGVAAGGGRLQIVALLAQLRLLVLESRREVLRRRAVAVDGGQRRAEERRQRRLLQVLDEVRVERREVHLVDGRAKVQPRAAGAAVGAGDLDAVDVGVGHGGKARERALHLGGADVLTLPAEGVADAVHPVEEARVVFLEQVARAEPGVARRRHVARDLLRRRLLVRVPLGFRVQGIGLGLGFGLGLGIGLGLPVEAPRRVVVLDEAHDLARLASLSLDAEARRRVANELVGVLVVPEDLDGVDLRQDVRHEADGAHLSRVVHETGVALRRRVELDDLLDAEALLELLPDVRPQAVAHGDADAEVLLARVLGLRRQVPRELADVLHHRDVVRDAVRREAP
mmetsp:Transcript_28248/g.90368  ORF Transcript_28248/g.90368 Transcript_28248/m.90368 type:complete len:397 (-) Transcript_28248:313-1503(-)